MKSFYYFHADMRITVIAANEEFVKYAKMMKLKKETL